MERIGHILVALAVALALYIMVNVIIDPDYMLGDNLKKAPFTASYNVVDEVDQ